MSALADLLRAAAESDDLPDSKLSHEEQVIALRESFARYTGPCPYKPGDFVTPRSGLNVHGDGTPCIVLEVRAEPEPAFTASEPRDLCSSHYGMRADMRVLCFSGVEQTAYWVESYAYECFDAPAAH